MEVLLQYDTRSSVLSSANKMLTVIVPFLIVTILAAQLLEDKGFNLWPPMLVLASYLFFLIFGRWILPLQRLGEVVIWEDDGVTVGAASGIKKYEVTTPGLFTWDKTGLPSGHVTLRKKTQPGEIWTVIPVPAAYRESVNNILSANYGWFEEAWWTPETKTLSKATEQQHYFIRSIKAHVFEIILTIIITILSFSYANCVYQADFRESEWKIVKGLLPNLTIDEYESGGYSLSDFDDSMTCRVSRRLGLIKINYAQP